MLGCDDSADGDAVTVDNLNTILTVGYVKIYIINAIIFISCSGTIAKTENICYIIFGMSSYDGGYTMNTQHLQYLIEIERTRSVSQAAENLFIGQPNLSRILHEMEANLGFKIFE